MRDRTGIENSELNESALREFGGGPNTIWDDSWYTGRRYWGVGKGYEVPISVQMLGKIVNLHRERRAMSRSLVDSLYFSSTLDAKEVRPFIEGTVDRCDLVMKDAEKIDRAYEVLRWEWYQSEAAL